MYSSAMKKGWPFFLPSQLLPVLTYSLLLADIERKKREGRRRRRTLKKLLLIFFCVLAVFEQTERLPMPVKADIYRRRRRRRRSKPVSKQGC